VEAKTNSGWKEIAEGTTIGYKRILRIEPARLTEIRVHIRKSLARPALSEIALYKASPDENSVKE
jgi:alpha-L-fucosidase